MTRWFPPYASIAIVFAVGLAIARPVAAQPPEPCAACARGDKLIEELSLEPLRSLSHELAALRLADPLTRDQYAHLLELRGKRPVLVRVGALSDDQLIDVAAALCQEETGPCVDVTTHGLRCFADRCDVDLPLDPEGGDILELPASCHQYNNPQRAPSYGLGFEWGTGWQRSAHPHEAYAFSFGLEGRLRFGQRFGAVARIDRVHSLDAPEDADHDRHDDTETGPIVRLATLAGPSLVLDNTRFHSTTRFLRLDLLGGYLSTRTQDAESGPAAGFDLAYQLSVFRFGVRVVQGFGDAGSASMVLAHLGIVSGARPGYRNEADCGALPSPRSTRLALAVDYPLVGAGLVSHFAYSVPGVGFEMAWHVVHKLDVLAHGDLIEYPGKGLDRDRAIHEAVLAGLRIDHMKHHAFTAVMAGYSLGSGIDADSGPIVDLSVAKNWQDDKGAAYLRLHGRFGVGSDNLDYRVVFLSFGAELRLDPHAWRDRDH